MAGTDCLREMSALYRVTHLDMSGGQEAFGKSV